MALTTDRDKVAHLLRRFGLGASEAEVDFYVKDGVDGAIALLLSDDPDDGFTVDPQSLTNEKGILSMPVTVNWWILRMLITRKPLREKMTLFWHDHFATSASKVQTPAMMLQQNETLRTNALGSFETLLNEVSKDPSMIYWLDNQENRRGHPNENFAREVMELFTLGIGNYTEKDVQEAARAFTGYAFRRTAGKITSKRGAAEYLFREGVHDKGSKTVLGQTGPLDGDDVLRILCAHPRTSEYLTQKIWNWFVWPDPDAATTAPFAKRFRESGLNVSSLLKDIMQSKEFYSAKAERSVVKNPVDFCVSTMRQLGVGEGLSRRVQELAEGANPRILLVPAQAAQIAMKGMGMWLMYPPDVAGWDIGQSWITSATIVERMGWGDKVFGQSQAARFQVRYPAYGLLSSDPTAKGIVHKLVSVYDAPIKPEKLPALIKATESIMGSKLTQANANKVAAQVSRLIFATPEFQFS